MLHKKNTSIKHNIITVIILLLFCSTLIIIFRFSVQSGQVSNIDSRRLAKRIATIWNDMFMLCLNQEELSLLTVCLYGPTRKAAHIIECGFLGVISTILCCRIHRIKYRFMSTVLCVLAVACLDEFQQLIGSGRGAHGTDIVLDVISGAVGSIFCYGMFYIFRRW